MINESKLTSMSDVRIIIGIATFFYERKKSWKQPSLFPSGAGQAMIEAPADTNDFYIQVRRLMNDKKSKKTKWNELKSSLIIENE